MNSEGTNPQKPSFGRRLLLAFQKTLIFLFKALLTLLIIGAIGIAIYLGAPVLINEYLLKDVKLNTSQIQEISGELEASDRMTTERLADLQDRLTSLETQGDIDKQSLADLHTQLTTAETSLKEQAESFQDLEALQLSLDEYAAALTSLEDQLADYQADLEEIQAELDTLNRTMVGNQSELADLNARFEAREPAEILHQELELLKVMELITRVRVSIGDQNFGLAREDLQAAQDLLLELGLNLPTGQAAYLDSIAERLSQAAANLVKAPSLVDQDLEVAWQFLLQGLPEETQSEADQPTPTPENSGEQVATPTPTPKP